MSDDAPEMNVSVRNFPPNGSEVELATVAYGPMGPMRVHLDVSLSEDEESLNIALTLSNLVEHDSIVEGIDNAIEMLTMIRDSAQPAIDEQINQSKES